MKLLKISRDVPDSVYKDLYYRNYQRFDEEYFSKLDVEKGALLKDEDKVTINTIFQDFKLLPDRNVNRNLQDLSTGNKKKVGIIQALLHRPKLLILDEPTNGLDPLMQSIFFEVLREENTSGTTIFYCSHILTEVQRLCKRVAVIRDGEIVATETMGQLREKQLKRWSRAKKEALISGNINLLKKL